MAKTFPSRETISEFASEVDLADDGISPCPNSSAESKRNAEIVSIRDLTGSKIRNPDDMSGFL
jgi:hypothetical protein